MELSRRTTVENLDIISGTDPLYGLHLSTTASSDDVIDHVTDGDVRTLTSDEVWRGCELGQPSLFQSTFDQLLCRVQRFYGWTLVVRRVPQ